MSFRIEFTKTNSHNFARVMSIARQFPGFKEWESDGLKLYSVEFDKKDYKSAAALMDFVRSWKSVAIYIDGQLTPRIEGSMAIYAEFHKRREMEYTFDRKYGRTPEEFVRKQNAKPTFFQFPEGEFPS